MDSPIRPVIARLTPIMRRHDMTAFQQALEQLVTQGERLSPAQLSLAIAELAPVLAKRPEGFYARLAAVAAIWIDDGGSPLPLAASPTSNALLAMWCRGRFEELWPVVGKGRPTPDPDEPPPMGELIGLFLGAAEALNLKDETARSIACSWFDAPHWVEMMISATAHREYRDTAGDLPHLLETATKIVDVVPAAAELVELARVLDDEPLVVLDHRSGRGFQLTMSGVGDSLQLEILLADRLIGDPAQGLLAGARPPAAWVDRATSGRPRSPEDDRIHSQFSLYDATGKRIRAADLPADLPVVADSRVIVLHAPTPNVSWLTGRPFEFMMPTLTLDHVMTADEAAQWRARVAPAPDIRHHGQR